jgi:2'-5' RNA ligase
LIRSFLAIELPKTILKKIEEVQRDLKSTHGDVRWVNSEKIHLTLKFFGNIEELRIDPIFKTIEEVIRNTPPFSLKVRGVGAFPHLKNPRVIWMGLVDGRETLISFQKQIDTLLKDIGRGKEELVGRMEKFKEEEFGTFQVERVVLFKSDLKPTGPIYTPLKEMKLGNK